MNVVACLGTWSFLLCLRGVRGSLLPYLDLYAWDRNVGCFSRNPQGPWQSKLYFWKRGFHPEQGHSENLWLRSDETAFDDLNTMNNYKKKKKRDRCIIKKNKCKALVTQDFRDHIVLLSHFMEEETEDQRNEIIFLRSHIHSFVQQISKQQSGCDTSGLWCQTQCSCLCTMLTWWHVSSFHLIKASRGKLLWWNLGSYFQLITDLALGLPTDRNCSCFPNLLGLCDLVSSSVRVAILFLLDHSLEPVFFWSFLFSSYPLYLFAGWKWLSRVVCLCQSAPSFLPVPKSGSLNWLL